MARRAVALDNGKARSSSPYQLDRISAPPIVFELRKRRYRIPADPDVEVVATLLRLEGELKRTGDDADEDLAESVIEAKDLVVELIGEQDPGFDPDDVRTEEELKRKPDGAPVRFSIGVGEILTLFALITGGESVADSVQEGITASMGAFHGADGDEPHDHEADGEGEEGGAPAAAPLRSRSRSSRRSSSSAGSTRGRRATGAG